MAIQITDDDQQKAVASIQRFFEKNMEEPIGNMAAVALFDFLCRNLHHWPTTGVCAMCGIACRPA